MDRKEQVLSLINGGLSQTKTAARMKMSRKTVKKIIESASTPSVLLKSKDLAPEKTVGKSLAEFRAQYDKATIIPAKIRAGLKKLGNGWHYEADFLKIADVSAVDLGRFRDQFSEYFVVTKRDGRKAWAGNIAFANNLRKYL
jgi:hypothetical protein